MRALQFGEGFTVKLWLSMQLHIIPVSTTHLPTEVGTDSQKLAVLQARHLGRLRLLQVKQRLPFLTPQKVTRQHRAKVVPMEQR